MSNIDDLKSTFTSGFARSNRYRVLFESTEYDPRSLDIMCDSVSLPGRQIFTEDKVNSLKQKKIAYQFGQEDIAMSFLLTNEWTAWNFIYDWQKTIIEGIENISGPFNVGYREEYSRDIVIEHLNSRQETMKRFRLMNAYPTSLDSIELSNASENEVIRVNANFTYDNWKLDGE